MSSGAAGTAAALHNLLVAGFLGEAESVQQVPLGGSGFVNDRDGVHELVAPFGAQQLEVRVDASMLLVCPAMAGSSAAGDTVDPSRTADWAWYAGLHAVFALHDDLGRKLPSAEAEYDPGA
mmetsp:Transcript_10010/g.17158  ORF Transcript_10010/g.17158 Transcript_10010/m.17158 type:complete len:121 (-) Transcript_10010:411-773(-)